MPVKTLSDGYLVNAVLFETGLAPHRLELEVTESILIGDYSRALSLLRPLDTLGVRIAMDEFSTGYSSLSYLQAFPFDKIKIDRSFVSNVGPPQSAAIIRAVIACDQVQGYLIGRPNPIEMYAKPIGLGAAIQDGRHWYNQR